ncbi:MAG: helix-turn-helix domain-containing protein [Rhodospirillaceae bacterium]|jgi:Predicted transcriptional regulator|nr:helix-turn-helix domain-containing protein [Rhodospirillaceae bacterium]
MSLPQSETRRRCGPLLIEGMEQAVAHKRGEIALPTRDIDVPDVDVKALRTARGMSQRELAAFYGFALSALRDWEQKRRRPDRAARVLLRVIEREPEAMERALSS